MSDRDLEGLRRRAEAGDGDARIELQRALVRGGERIDGAWTNLPLRSSLGVPDSFGDLNPSRRAALEQDLGALDPYRLVANSARDMKGDLLLQRRVVLARYGATCLLAVGHYRKHRITLELGAPSARSAVQCWDRGGRWRWDLNAPPVVTQVVASPRGEVATASSDGLLTLREESGAVRWQVEVEARALTFADDRLAWADPRSACIADAATGEVRARRRLGKCSAVSFAPDLSAVVIANAKGLESLPLPEGPSTWQADQPSDGEHPTHVSSLAHSRSGESVAVSGGSVWVRASADGSTLLTYRHGREAVTRWDDESVMGLGRDSWEEIERCACATLAAFYEPKRACAVGLDATLRYYGSERADRPEVSDAFLAVSKRGKVAVGASSGAAGLYVVTRKKARRLETPTHPTAVTWLPGGSLLVAGREGLHRLDPANGRVTPFG